MKQDKCQPKNKYLVSIQETAFSNVSKDFEKVEQKYEECKQDVNFQPAEKIHLMSNKNEIIETVDEAQSNIL